EFQEDDRASAIAAEWGVDADLLIDLEGQWQLHERISGDTVVAYYVEFDRDVDRELLDALGVPPGEYSRELSLNFDDQPEPEPE
ncbi:hypothetical protein, partial [Streptomyces sp. NPDC051577]|uniref:hypothetical protein n=1 Tax=Streptomyces sp. NPDC051577 TaxID=3155166 RepID=UPI00341D8FAC